MSKKAISFTKLSDTLQISEHHDGFWLYDFTRGMNLAMRAKSRDEAFTEALSYYQDRLKEYEGMYASLKSRVDSFVEQFTEKTESEDE
jgi:hypothetical protein